MQIITVLSENTNDTLWVANFSSLFVSSNFKLIILPQVVDNELISVAFALKNYYKFYPKKTIHIVLFNDVDSFSDHLLLLIYQQYYFIFFDNGLINLVFDKLSNFKLFKYKIENNVFEKIKQIVLEIENQNFSGLPTVSYKKKFFPQPFKNNNLIIGRAIYFTSNGNIISNIHKNDILELKQNSFIFEISYRHILKIPLKFDFKGIECGESYGFFNSYQYLELTQKCGNLKQILNAKIDDEIILRIIDNRLKMKKL